MEKARNFPSLGTVTPARPASSPESATAGQSGAWMSEDLKDSLIQRVARLEAALTLTAGTVHDVNNVMTVLAGNLFLLTENVRDIRDRPELYEQARRARNAAERGSTLLRELLTFGREADDEAKAISPGDHVTALQPLLARAVGSDHQLEIRIEPEAGSVVASAAQFESALINLAINARDALKSKGKVCIEVRKVEFTARRPATHVVEPGSYVCLEVSDNGCGISKAHLDRVTEPLFTTKPRDHGSGLGLSMVKHFAEVAGGALCIESTEGRGTRVTLWLPCSERLAETTANMTLPLSTLPGGDERLVLVSRDPDVRLSIQQILEALGYTVQIAENAERAERLLAQSPYPELLIAERSDRRSGVEKRWLRSLRELNGRLKHIALLETGVDAVDAASDADGHVYRPVNVLSLARTVRKVLET